MTIEQQAGGPPKLDMRNPRAFRQSLADRAQYAIEQKIARYVDELTSEAWGIYQDESFQQSLREGTGFSKKQRSVASALAITAYSIHQIAIDEKTQYRLRYEGRNDAFLGQAPKKFIKGDGFRPSKNTQGDVFFSTHIPKNRKNHITADVASRALTQLLVHINEPLYARAHDYTPQEMPGDSQFLHVDGSFYHIRLTKGVTLKVIVPREKRTDPRPSLSTKKTYIHFALHVGDPHQTLEAQYQQIKHENALRDLDRTLSPETILTACIADDPNARTFVHALAFDIPETVPAYAVLHSLRERLDGVWSPTGEPREKAVHFKHSQSGLVIDSIRSGPMIHGKQQIQLSIVESAAQFEARKASRKEQLPKATKHMIHHEINARTSENPIVLIGKKRIHDIPVAAQAEKRRKGEPHGKIYTKFPFDQAEVGNEVAMQFPVHEDVVKELGRQITEQSYSRKRILVTQTIAGKEYSMVYAIRWVLKKGKEPTFSIVCWKASEEDESNEFHRNPNGPNSLPQIMWRIKVIQDRPWFS